MGWSETDPVTERGKMIKDYQSGLYTKTELAVRYHVSRQTIDTTVKRFEKEGYPGLEERSRAPLTCPHRMSAQCELILLELRRSRPDWGPVSLRSRAESMHPSLLFPSVSAIGDLIKRHGLIEHARSKRIRNDHARSPMADATAPHSILAVDFKGQFRLGNGQYCYPLTCIDQYSRFLLCCRGLESTAGDAMQRWIERVLRDHGMPEMIRSDNGTPFASNGRWGLSRFGVWLMKLGIIHEKTRPSCPQDNGRLERFHRTLKADTARPPAATMRKQQNRFDVFRGDFNDHRGHQGIGGAIPASLHSSSPRTMPSTIPRPEYPGHYEVRRVSSTGQISICGQRIYLNETLASETVGLQEVDDGIWSINFYQTLLGRFDERTGDVC